MKIKVLIYAEKIPIFQNIIDFLFKENIDCVLTTNLNQYIKILKENEITISIIDHYSLEKEHTNFAQVYYLLSLKKVFTQIIIGGKDLSKALEVDSFYNRDVTANELINDILMHYESAQVFFSMEGRSDSLLMKDEIDENILQDLAIKDRKISSLYIQLAEFQNKISKLYQSWERLNISKNLKKVHDFHNQFKLMVAEQKQDWEEFHEHFVLIHPHFFKDIKSKYQILTEENLRMCAYLRMGMSNSEIASYLNILPNSVNRAQNRIKHKLNIPEEETLRKFIQDIG